MSREERFIDIPHENYTFCDVCGRKVPVSQIGGKCVSCGRKACTRCTVPFQNRIYCTNCAPPPPPPPLPRSSGRCFIATAAYGTSMAEEIQILRRFRDRSLNPHFLGQHLIAFYYAISPKIAARIAASHSARKWVRMFLKPIVTALKRLAY